MPFVAPSVALKLPLTCTGKEDPYALMSGEAALAIIQNMRPATCTRDTSNQNG